MPAALTYPGVYVEEIPSGVRTIAGVSTSDTAFVDFFRRGPLNHAERITSFGDFERVFGGLDARSDASYALRQYFGNGGNVAWVVRVAGGTPQPAAFAIPGAAPAGSPFRVQAANPGGWGNSLQVAVTSAPEAGQFNLFVREVATVNGVQQVVASESFRNLSTDPASPRNALAVVNASSRLVRLTDPVPDAAPTASAPTPSGGAPEGAFSALAGGTDGSQPGADALIGSEAQKTGLFALERIQPFVFNLLAIPAATRLNAEGYASVVATAEAYCESRRAFLIVDVPESIDTPAEMTAFMATNDGLRHQNAAIYFPRLRIPDPLNENRPRDVAASGTLAGVFARTDATRGVWKAPAGTDADLRGATPVVVVNDRENGGLNPLGINVLRTFPIFGPVCWGARTLDGSDQQASEWKYISVRRTALFIEESLYQGLKWVVFEPNDEPLWAQIRLNVGAFMQNLFRQGAFQGKSPAEAYFVRCDKETTTQNDIDRGVVNILVGFAPLKPAEFVVIRIQQIAGQVTA